MGRPGIIIISPQMGIRKPAPTLARSSRTRKVNPLGAPLAAGSLLRRERGVQWREHHGEGVQETGTHHAPLCLAPLANASTGMQHCTASHT